MQDERPVPGFELTVRLDEDADAAGVEEREPAHVDPHGAGGALDGLGTRLAQLWSRRQVELATHGDDHRARLLVARYVEGSARAHRVTISNSGGPHSAEDRDFRFRGPCGPGIS